MSDNPASFFLYQDLGPEKGLRLRRSASKGCNSNGGAQDLDPHHFLIEAHLRVRLIVWTHPNGECPKAQKKVSASQVKELIKA